MNATDDVKNEGRLHHAIAPLLESREPLLIGVRHHSAMLARTIPQMLSEFQPESLLIELPADLQDWIEFLAHDDTIAPVAISAVDENGFLFFYPMADFSPELAAIRWADAHGVPVTACDLSVSAKAQLDDAEATQADQVDVTLLDRLQLHTGDTDTGQLWQRLVESPGCDASAESLRRAALMFGWIVRNSHFTVSARDNVREAAMRRSIRNAPPHSAAVVGSFHAAALIPDVVVSTQENDDALLASAETSGGTNRAGVSLIPYSFDQLDERSGYPAGIRDPIWHQRMLEANNNEQMDEAASELTTKICRELRRMGHVAGTPDATESLRVMRDLARLRRLPTPGRSEFVEAIQSCLVQGDLMGRGRAVAKAASYVLIGDRRGAVTSTTPRCGLAVSLMEQLLELKLPTSDQLHADSRLSNSGSHSEAKEFKLDVLRKPRDRARAVMLRRMCAASIPYAKRLDTIQLGHRENLIERWEVVWQQGTEATIESLSRHGVTLTQVVESLVREIGRSESSPAISSSRDITGQGASDLPLTILRRLDVATNCGLITLSRQCLDAIDGDFRQTAGLGELVQAITILARLRAGHFPGLPKTIDQAYPPIVNVFALADPLADIDNLLRNCLDRLSGLAGSDKPDDVGSLVDLVDWFTSDLAIRVTDFTDDSNNSQHHGSSEKLARFSHWCRQTLTHGSDRMRGAAAGLLCQLYRADSVVIATSVMDPTDVKEWDETRFAAVTSGWLDAAVDREGRQRLTLAMAGATQVLLAKMQNDPQWLLGVRNGICRLDDQRFLQRLPSLRAAFNDFSPADRRRLLETQLMTLQERGSAMDVNRLGDPDQIADELARLRSADLAGHAEVIRLFPEMETILREEHEPHWPENNSEAEPSETNDVADNVVAAGDLSLADRWRLIFGLPPENPPPQFGDIAKTLDQLYGRSRGEGSRNGIGAKGGGGTEAPQPTTAQWADDLEALFGSDVCQEVLGQSAITGRSGAMALLDPDAVTPSIDLLQQVLSLAGAMPESKTDQLRKLARKITQQLAQELAVRMRPAMSGLSTPRPTRRRSRQLNLARTIRSNLRNVHRLPDGRVSVIAEQLIFNAPARREMDWHLTFVVDVSGSMSASVIYSALVAAIFDALPALSVRFIAFSTEVIDFSEQVADPLSLLLEVQVGGGTDIGLGLRAARAEIKVPSRSLVVLVSDFEEGVSVGRMIAEVRALVDSGVKCVGLASLDDAGVARFHQGYAQLVASAGMPVAAVSPEKLARWVGDQIRNNNSSLASVTQ